MIRSARNSNPPHFALTRTVVRALVLALIGVFGANQSMAADRVELVAGKDGKPGSKLQGDIVDIRSGQLTLRRTDGREDAYPLARIAKWETTWPANAEEARRRVRERKFAEAVELFRSAAAGDNRGWIKRALIAEAIGCYRELNQPIRAGDLFVSLSQNDPDTPYLDALPLAWTPVVDPPRELQEAADRWLAIADSPAAVLLGASWLISLGHPERVMPTLQKLTTNRDVRLALLAETQLWRTKSATAAESEVERWGKVIERLPRSLRPGPYFVLGQTFAGRNEAERAALAFLRVPVEYPEQVALSAESLEAAAAQLDRLDRKPESQELRRELAALRASLPAATTKP